LVYENHNESWNSQHENLRIELLSCIHGLTVAHHFHCGYFELANGFPGGIWLVE
jgi:hypothetical protein